MNALWLMVIAEWFCTAVIVICNITGFVVGPIWAAFVCVPVTVFFVWLSIHMTRKTLHISRTA
jgi:hypothetical protein